MICPIMLLKEKELEIGLSNGHDCLGGTCAWYDENKKQCVIQSIKDALMRVKSPSA